MLALDFTNADVASYLFIKYIDNEFVIFVIHVDDINIFETANLVALTIAVPSKVYLE